MTQDAEKKELVTYQMFMKTPESLLQGTRWQLLMKSGGEGGKRVSTPYLAPCKDGCGPHI